MKPVPAVCTIMLVATPAAGFAQDRSYPDFGSIGKTAGRAPGKGPRGETGPAPSAKAKDETPAPSPLAVASISLPAGHRVDFFAPPNGPLAIAEVGPNGT